MNKQTTLYSLISDRADLTKEQKFSLFLLLSTGTRKKTRDALCSKIDHVPLSCWENFGIFRRVQFDNPCRVTYCAGQCYTSELACVRKLVLGR